MTFKQQIQQGIPNELPPKQRKEWFLKGYQTGNLYLGTIEKIYSSIPY